MESSQEILQNTAHRPYPLPNGPWVMRQTWRHLLFAHWPVPAETLKPILPKGIELDTYNGQAYVGVLPFYRTNVRVRMLPQIPGVSSMPQINIRTYVRREDKPGVYFLALDTNNLPTVLMTRLTLGLPYYQAELKWSTRRDSTGTRIECHSTRLGSADRKQSLGVSFEPISVADETVDGSLDHWLVERYCLYTVHLNRLLRVDIHHKKWKIQHATAKFYEHSLLDTYLHHEERTERVRAPLLHYAREMDALMWASRILSPVNPVR